MRQGMSVEQQIIDLLNQLQRLVRPPTWSFQLEEIGTLVAELAACWDLYRRGGDCDDQLPREGHRCAESAEYWAPPFHPHPKPLPSRGRAGRGES
jgi:hypothetical protein